MSAAELIIAAAAEKGAAFEDGRAESIRKVVEDTQNAFDERAARMAMTSHDLDRAYSL